MPTALARLDLHSGLGYTEQNHIEKWCQTVVMRMDRFQSFWREVQPAHGAGCDGSGIITTTIDRIRRSTDERRSRGLSTRQYGRQAVVSKYIRSG